MGKDRILVVDDELDNRVMMRYFLESWGYDVDLAADGKEALSKVSAHPPTLVLLDLEMPVMNGFDTCNRLKTDPATEHIPVIMFTGLEQTADKVKGIRGGADDYVVKTVDPEELQVRIEMILRRARRYEAPTPPAAPVSDQAVSGSLSELYFPEAMQLILAYGKTGVLRLQDGNKEGRVYLKEGQVVHAEFGELEGEDAFYELALWKSGHFGFQTGEIPSKETIQRSGTNLLIEATRRLDEWNLISSKIPNFEVVPRRAALPGGSSIRITQEDWKVICQIDGKRTIRQLVEANGLDLFETGRVLYGLITVGVVTLKAQADSKNPAHSLVAELANELTGSEPHEITALQWKVLSQVDGHRTIDAIASLSDLAPAQVLEAVQQLSRAGFVRPLATGADAARKNSSGRTSQEREASGGSNVKSFRPRIRAIGFD